MAPYKNYTLGKAGVNVDKSDLHVSPEELRQAQNAIRNKLGVDGGLCNRPGLVKFNSVAAAGSLLGGIGVPNASLVDNSVLYLAKKNGTDENWYTSSDLFGSGAQNSNIAAWKDPADLDAALASVSHSGAFWNGQLYYAGADYTQGTTSPTIRVFNGTDDRELCKVLPATTKGITSFVVDKSQLYVLTLDSGTTDADWVGRVFALNEKGHLRQIGNAIDTGYIPTALAVYNNIIFVGGSRTTVTNEAKIFRLNPGPTLPGGEFTSSIGETTWTLDDTLPADDYMITALKVFNGELYATTKNGGAATKGKIRKRTIGAVWSTVDSTINNSGTYESLEVFDTRLYASSRSYDAAANTAVIRRSSDGASWTTVYNSATTTGVGHLVRLGLRLFSQFGTGILHTLNGTSYTSATPPGSGNVDGALGLLLRKGGKVDVFEAASRPRITTVNVTNVGGGGPTIVLKSADETVNNSSVLQNDDTLLFACAANKTYIVEGFLMFTSANTTPDTKVDIQVPSGAEFYWGPGWKSGSAYWDIVSSGLTASALLLSNSAIDFADNASGSRYGFGWRGILIVGSTSGTFQVRWAQQVANPTDTIMKAGSCLRYQLAN